MTSAFRGGELWISGLFGVLEVYDADTGALKGTVVHDDGTLYQQSETGPSCFVGNQLVMLSPLGITYYDVVAVPRRAGGGRKARADYPRLGRMPIRS